MMASRCRRGCGKKKNLRPGREQRSHRYASPSDGVGFEQTTESCGIMGRQRSRVVPDPIEVRGKRTFEREMASARRNFSPLIQTMVCDTFQYTVALVPREIRRRSNSVRIACSI
ncbi:hypothetical protein ISCGN_027050 [Ixodes scapularis]